MLATVGWGVAVAAAFAVVVLVALAILGVGAGAQEDAPDVATRTIRVTHVPPDEVLTPLIVDSLDPTTVLTVHARGFEGDRTGFVRQCRVGEQNVCRNRLAVRFDGNGTALFQYLVTDGGGCRLRAAERCTLEIVAGDTHTIIDTIFVDSAPPPGRVSVTPRRDLEVGDTVTLEATGFPANVTLIATVCAVPSISGPRCGAPGPAVELVTDADGAASTALTLDVHEIGVDRVTCSHQSGCRVVVESDAAAVRAFPVRLSFSQGPGAAYDSVRLAIGIVATIALGLGAVGLVRWTDWAPPPEADGRAIDDADYADLDVEADRFDEGRPLATVGDSPPPSPEGTPQ
ncbi:MAG: hypothetical protein HKN26_01135 [Acidimicrobiales bacterium]|nr:hypothetical protein [Acidimicrobiales bacterium]